MNGMRLGLLVLVALVWPGQVAFAQEQGSKIHMHAAEGYAADGFLFAPQGQGPFPAVLLIHDADGLTDYVRATAQRLAAQGDLVVAIDLYRGRSGNTPQEAQQLANGLSDADAMHDLVAALGFLRSLPNVRPGALGVAGWGTGSRYAMQLASDATSLRALAITASDAMDLKLAMRCKIAFMGSFTGDASSAQVHSLEATLGKGGRSVDIKVYPQAHGRFYDPRAVDYRAQDSADVIDRLARFFADALDTQHPSSAHLWGSPAKSTPEHFNVALFAAE
jgi:carboxymethylenebutenolidase